MIRRISRLVAAELLKIANHPFVYVAVGLLILVIPFWQKVHTDRESIWHGLHSIQLFAYGMRPAMKIVTYVVLIISSMLFSGEFDRGTIKILLTRPVTRTDFFIAKCITMIAVTAFFFLVAAYVSLLFAGLGGELGPVWDDDVYVSNVSGSEITGHAWKAMGWSILPLFAAAFLGLLFSNLSQSSGFAVAGTLMGYLLVDVSLMLELVPVGAAVYLFPFYPQYVFEVLAGFSEGGSLYWLDRDGGFTLHVTAPLVTMAAFIAASYLRFRYRDITA